MLGQGPDAAMFLTAVLAYSTSMTFTVGLRLRHPLNDYYANVHAGLTGMPLRGPSRGDPEGRFMLGIQLSDGRRAVMTSSFTPEGIGAAAQPAAVSLLSIGGAFGDLSTDARYWLRPLPPAGPLMLVMRWETMGIAETVTELDGTKIAAAGATATTLWPPVPPQERELPPPPPPPTSGWFADTIEPR